MQATSARLTYSIVIIIAFVFFEKGFQNRLHLYESVREGPGTIAIAAEGFYLAGIANDHESLGICRKEGFRIAEKICSSGYR